MNKVIKITPSKDNNYDVADRMQAYLAEYTGNIRLLD
jgi:hypothetical protein